MKNGISSEAQHDQPRQMSGCITTARMTTGNSRYCGIRPNKTAGLIRLGLTGHDGIAGRLRRFGHVYDTIGLSGRLGARRHGRVGRAACDYQVRSVV